MAVFTQVKIPSVRHVMGRLSAWAMGLMLMLMSDRIRPTSATATHALAPSTSMPGTSHTAAPTAMAVTSQRMMKFIADPHERKGCPAGGAGVRHAGGPAHRVCRAVEFADPP